MKKIRLLTLQQIVEPYRFKFYEILNKDNSFEITAFSDHQKFTPLYFNNLLGKSVHFLGFKFQYGYWRSIFSGKVDSVIAEFDLHIVSNILLILVCKLKGIGFSWWGLGFGKSRWLHPVRVALVRLADSVIVYEENAKDKFTQKGISVSKIFVKHNTVYVESPSINRDANSRTKFLVVGTLNKRKEIDKLIRAFSSALQFIPEDIELSIIGDGDAKRNLELLGSEMGLGARITFYGRLQEEQELKTHFQESIAMVHPGQAGLSVLHAMAYGVPFITKKGATSGGEIENIKDEVNGLLFSGEIEDLTHLLIRLSNDRSEAVRLGEQGYLHYTQNRSMQHMANTYLSAARFAYDKQRGK